MSSWSKKTKEPAQKQLFFLLSSEEAGKGKRGEGGRCGENNKPPLLNPCSASRALRVGEGTDEWVKEGGGEERHARNHAQQMDPSRTAAIRGEGLPEEDCLSLSLCFLLFSPSLPVTTVFIVVLLLPSPLFT